MISLRLLNHASTLWTVLIVSELFKNGIDTYFVSPGNRNVPIMAALGAVPGVSVKIAPDERASAYRALGHAKAAGRPGVLVCTSGTAAANYYPAVIEAFRDEIPMMVWSADRPPELIGADANQTIDQTMLFGRFVIKHLNLPCPTFDYPLRGLLSKICDMAAVKNGPVHINLPFREPLLPISEDLEGLSSIIRDLLANPNLHTRNISTVMNISVPAREELQQVLGMCERGLVIVGRPGPGEDMERVAPFIDRLQWPVFCDMASGLKGRLTGNLQVPFLDHPEMHALIREYAPEVVIQFGTGLVSKAYYSSVLEEGNPPPALIQATSRTGIRNPGHQPVLKINMTVQEAVLMLETLRIPRPDNEAGKRFARGIEVLSGEIDRNTPQEILSHPLIVKTLYSIIPENEVLFVGNSLVIRAFDLMLPDPPKKIGIVSNRGVSGIEGNIATAVGFAEGSAKRITLVLGDIAFLHDLNSLLLAERSAVPVIIVVINNNGGRIFERLPVAGFPGIPEDWVTTPHQYDFKMVSAQFNLPYRQVHTPVEFRDAYETVLENNCSALIEVCLNSENDLKVFKARNAVKVYENI